jgi:hypothetical protein
MINYFYNLPLSDVCNVSAERGSGEEFIPMLLSNHAERDENGGAEGHESAPNYCSSSISRGGVGGSTERLQIITCIDDSGVGVEHKRIVSSDDVTELLCVGKEDRQPDGGENQSQLSGEFILELTLFLSKKFKSGDVPGC